VLNVAVNSEGYVVTRSIIYNPVIIDYRSQKTYCITCKRTKRRGIVFIQRRCSFEIMPLQELEELSMLLWGKLQSLLAVVGIIGSILRL